MPRRFYFLASVVSNILCLPRYPTALPSRVDLWALGSFESPPSETSYSKTTTPHFGAVNSIFHWPSKPPYPQIELLFLSSTLPIRLYLVCFPSFTIVAELCARSCLTPERSSAGRSYCSNMLEKIQNHCMRNLRPKGSVHILSSASEARISLLTLQDKSCIRHSLIGSLNTGLPMLLH